MREPRKVPLEVPERFAVLQLLPEKSNFLNMKLIRELKEALVLTSEEVDKIELVQTPEGNVQWNAEKAEGVVAEIPFDPKALVMVIEALEKLDKDEALEPRHLSLYEKFVVCDEDSKVAGTI